MRRIGLIGVAAVLSCALFGCAGQDAGSDGSSSSAESPSASSTSSLASSSAEAHEGLPEYITSETVESVTDVPACYYAFVDGKDVVFKLADIAFPSQLTVQETTQILTGGETDLNLDELTVGDYIGRSEDRYSYFKADGTIDGTLPTTSHRLSFSVGQQKEPFTLEYVEGLRDDATVSEVALGDATGYMVVPDGVSPDGGFVYANLYLNAGTYEHGDEMFNFVIEVSYEGGMMDYTDVDFEELKSTMLKLVKPDFTQIT